MDDFCLRLAEARKVQGMTQEQLAQQLHVSRQTVSHWENGRALPDVVMLQQLEEVLGMPLLLTSSDQKDAPEPEVKPLPDRPVRLSRMTVVTICVLSVCVALLGALLALERLPSLAADQEALIVVTPATEVAYLVERTDLAEEWVGWDVNFSYENVSDVPFKPDYILIRCYQDDTLAFETKVDYAYLLPHMGSDKLIRGNHPLRWPVGANDLSLTRLECTIYGTDDNGNALSFSGDVHYICDFAPGSGK